jgi:hypothetical protein
MWEQGTKGKDQRPSHKIKSLNRGAKKEEGKSHVPNRPSQEACKKEKGGTLEKTHI